MAGARQDHELAVGPGLRELPGGAEWCADVELAVDQDARDVGEAVGVGEQLVVGQPGGVAEVVGDQAGEAKPERWVVVARVRMAAGLDRNDGLLPVTPAARGALLDVGIRIDEQAGIGCDEIAVAIGGRNCGPKAFPLRGEERPDATAQPVDLRFGVSWSRKPARSR